MCVSLEAVCGYIYFTTQAMLLTHFHIFRMVVWDRQTYLMSGTFLMPYKDIAQSAPQACRECCLFNSQCFLRQCSTTFMTSYCVVHPQCVFVCDKCQHEWVTKVSFIIFPFGFRSCWVISVLIDACSSKWTLLGYVRSAIKFYSVGEAEPPNQLEHMYGIKSDSRRQAVRGIYSVLPLN